MAFWNLIIDYLKNLMGIDLFEKAMADGTAAPAQAYLNLIFTTITFILGFLMAYRGFYLIVGLFARERKYAAHPMDKRYAFILSARNEEKVLPNLISSIRQMDYPQELIDIYVVADNCTDKTGEVAEKMGCKVYRRNDPEHARKGYALQYLFKELAKEFPIETYYGYCVMDSDNVVSKGFLRKMNDCLQDGNYGMVTGYRNVKNMHQNWVSAINGINMLRGIVSINRPRAVLHAPETISGTGFIMRDYLLKDGWYTTGLLEDGQMTAELMMKNVKTGFCEAAEFYDEQPSSVKISFRQRIRWTRGSLDNWVIYGPKLIWSGIKKPFWGKYDFYWDIFPYAFISFLLSFLYQILSLIFFRATGIYAGYNWSNFWNFVITGIVGAYLGGWINGLIVIIREWKKIHFNIPQAIIYLFCWPFYDMVNVFISIVCLFMKVTWKPIPHDCVEDVSNLEKEESDKVKKS